MKKLFGLLAATVLAGTTSVWSEGMELSGKLDIGYATGASYFDTDYGSGYGEMSGFELYPALVIVPEKNVFEGQTFYLSYEASLDMVFGKSDYYDGYKSNVFTPGCSVLFNYPIVPEDAKDGSFLSKLTPYAGVSLGIPIQKTTFTIPTLETYEREETYTTMEWNDSAFQYEEVEKTRTVTDSRVVDKDYSSTKIGLGMGITAGMNYEINDTFVANIETGYNFLKFHEFFFRAGVTYRFQRKGGAASATSSSTESAKASGEETTEKKAKDKKSEKASKVDENAIAAGSDDDPFKGTSWESKGITVLEFGTDGSVECGTTTTKYTVKKDGDSYVATLKIVGRKQTLTLSSKDATEAVDKQGSVEFTCTRK